MRELLAWAGMHQFLTLVAICFSGFILWTFAESIGTIGRRTTIVHHHHHAEECRREHEKGPCRKE